MEETEIGKVTHYYSKIGVGVIELSGALKVGEEIHITGHTTDLIQKVESIQIEHASAAQGEAGQVIAIKVKDHVRQHDKVHKVFPPDPG